MPISTNFDTAFVVTRITVRSNDVGTMLQMVQQHRIQSVHISTPHQSCRGSNSVTDWKGCLRAMLSVSRQCMYTHARPHTHAHARTHAYARTRTHARTRTRIRTYTHTDTCLYTYTSILALPRACRLDATPRNWCCILQLHPEPPASTSHTSLGSQATLQLY